LKTLNIIKEKQHELDRMLERYLNELTAIARSLKQDPSEENKHRYRMFEKLDTIPMDMLTMEDSNPELYDLPKDVYREIKRIEVDILGDYAELKNMCKNIVYDR